MEKGTLSNVMTIDIYDADSNFTQLIGTSTTMTETSLSGTYETNNSLKAGEFNSVISEIISDPAWELTLKDQTWDLSYLSYTTGCAINFGGEMQIVEEVVVDADGKGTVVNTPFTFVENGDAYGQATIKGEEGTYRVKFTGKEFTEEKLANKTVCVKYFYTNKNARKATITTASTPKVVGIVGKINIKGVGKHDGQKIGQLNIFIPTLRFTGETTITLQSGNTSDTPLNGKILASDDLTSCEGETSGKFFDIVVSYDENWYDDVQEIVVNGDDTVATGSDITPEVIAIHTTASNTPVDAEDLTFTIPSSDSAIATVDATGKVTGVGAGTTTLTVALKDKPSVTEDFTITVE